MAPTTVTVRLSTKVKTDTGPEAQRQVDETLDRIGKLTGWQQLQVAIGLFERLDGLSIYEIEYSTDQSGD